MLHAILRLLFLHFWAQIEWKDLQATLEREKETERRENVGERESCDGDFITNAADETDLFLNSGASAKSGSLNCNFILSTETL